jgi:5-hydroxyisourate hydrolase
MPASYKSPITSHILDTSRGTPASNVRIELHALDSVTGQWSLVNHGLTNSDGRVATALVPEGFVLSPGTYKMVFDTKSYFEQTGVTEYFYPDVAITFLIRRTDQHYHVPLLINPFGYSTYRGS